MLTCDQASSIYQDGPETTPVALLEMDGQMGTLTAPVEALKDQLAKSNRYRGKPPSTDGFRKPAPKHLRAQGAATGGRAAWISGACVEDDG